MKLVIKGPKFYVSLNYSVVISPRLCSPPLSMRSLRHISDIEDLFDRDTRF